VAYGQGVADGREKTFFIEIYVPQLDEASAVAISSRFRAAVARRNARGGTLRWIRSFALVGEETYCCVIGAPDIDQIVQLNVRGDLEYDHLVEVVALEPLPPRPA
jgi:hypothetical protein